MSFCYDCFRNFFLPESISLTRGNTSSQIGSLVQDMKKTHYPCLNFPHGCPQGVMMGLKEQTEMAMVFFLGQHQAKKVSEGVVKFSEIEQDQWSSVKEYFDTALLPVTGLKGNEQPWEVTKALKELRDALDFLEIPYKGRTVTYPSIHFINEENGESAINTCCRRLKEAGFSYVVVVTANEDLASLHLAEADLLFFLNSSKSGVNPEEYKNEIALKVQQLWFGSNKCYIITK